MVNICYVAAWAMIASLLPNFSSIKLNAKIVILFIMFFYVLINEQSENSSLVFAMSLCLLSTVKKG